jgi:hypothetical protein
MRNSLEGVLDTKLKVSWLGCDFLRHKNSRRPLPH